MRVRVLTTGGQTPEIVQAVDTGGSTVFVDTLGKRWGADEVISFRPIVDTAGNPL